MKTLLSLFVITAFLPLPRAFGQVTGSPTVYIDAPAPGATVSGIVTISGWAVDNASEVGTAISSAQVMVDGTVVGTATYGLSRPDVCAVYPDNPGCPNVGYSYSLNTSTLSVGSHIITVTATDSDATPDTGSSSVTVNVQTTLPTVYIDAPASGAMLSGIVAISGWAVDNAAEVGTAISRVRVKVDGTVVGTATYGLSRPDVCAVYPGRPGCPNVGYSYSLDTSALSVGAHSITVTATDRDATRDSGSSSVTVNVQTPPPTVYIDTPALGAIVSGIVAISGWAVDNATEVGTAISSVQVKVDGSVVGTATYGISRPDVCAAYPSRSGCPNVGYSYSLNTSALSVGSHTIMVMATDSDGTPDTGSSSVTVNVQAPLPTVYIDAPAQGSAVSDTVTVSGWAVDNASEAGTAISSVQVMVDGTVVGTATYGISRPDVCAVYPGRPGCPNVGYSFSLNTSTLSAGSHTLTVTATDSDATPDSGSSSVTVTTTSPSITSLSPTAGPVGAAVTINGTNFGSSQQTSTVTFNGTNAAVMTWSSGSITATVPSGATTGNVFVTVNGVPSNGVNFTVTSTSLSITLSPQRAAVTLSQTEQFAATVSIDPQNEGVSWSVDGVTGGNTTVGTISSTGLFTPGTQPGVHAVSATSNFDPSASASAMIAVSDLAGVFTYHNDTARTGQNLQEYALTPATVNSSTFGALFSCPVDGYVYGQPLYVANVNFAGQMRNVVLIVTEHDSVYAFDADSPGCLQLWQDSFLSPGVTTVPPEDTGETDDLVPEIGITSTPVIDPSTNTFYVVAKTKETVASDCSTDNPCYVHRLHALDLVTGAEKLGSPVMLTAPDFVPLFHLQRPALLLNNGTVYVAFGSHGDHNLWQGWLMAYDAMTLTQDWAWHATDPASDTSEGAIWGSGNGPAADASGNIYVETGNGYFDGINNFSDSVVKLSPAGALLDYFTPFDQDVMQENDIDLGSSGPMILPDAVGSSAHPHLMIASGKVGVVYLLDTTALGQYDTATNHDVGEVSVGFNTTDAFGGFYGQPAYWNGNIFTVIVGDFLRQYTISNATLSTVSSSNSSNTFGNRVATPTISASGATNGIVWVADVAGYDSGNPVILDAYDATDVSNLLYSSPDSGPGAAAVSSKFTVPTIANGKVYVGGQYAFTVFGLLPN